MNEKRSHNWLAGLFASHPPSAERVETNRETAASLPQGGIIGKSRYEERITPLKNNQKGYESYAKGRDALEKGDTRQAMAYARDAIRIEPREGQFYGLRADVHYQKQEYDDALTDYDRAVNLNPDYFYFYLQRGLTKKKLNLKKAAYADLQASTRLLPTAVAYNGLGELEMAAGESQKALQYFSEAASSDSPAGKQARISLLRYNFSSYANQYIQVQTGLNHEGYVLARITNQAPLAVRNLQLLVKYPDISGTMHQTTRLLSENIPAGQAYTTNLNLGPYANAAALKTIDIQITNGDLIE